MTAADKLRAAKAVPMQKRFCVVCGLWFGEFMACELPDCRLETDEEVAERLQRRELAEREEAGDG